VLLEVSMLLLAPALFFNAKEPYFGEAHPEHHQTLQPRTFVVIMVLLSEENNTE
jgi:hypothetical protein